MLTICRRKCCWNPFGTCSRQRNCPCHPKDERTLVKPTDRT